MPDPIDGKIIQANDCSAGTNTLFTQAEQSGRKALGEAGIAALLRVAKDRKAPAGSVVAAGRALCEVAGLLADAKRPRGEVKELHDMTPDELASFISQAEGELARKARVIETVGTQQDAKLLDMLE